MNSTGASIQVSIFWNRTNYLFPFFSFFIDNGNLHNSRNSLKFDRPSQISHNNSLDSLNLLFSFKLSFAFVRSFRTARTGQLAKLASAILPMCPLTLDAQLARTSRTQIHANPGQINYCTRVLFITLFKVARAHCATNY